MASTAVAERNQEIVSLIMTGSKSTGQIAKKYKISERTVKTICKDFAQNVFTPVRGEIAIANTNMWTMGKIHAFNPNLLISRKGMGVIDEMRKDDQIKAALWFKKLAVVSAGWEVVSPEELDETYVPHKFTKYLLQDLDQPLNSIITGGVLTALDYGFSISELVFKEINRGEFSGLVGLEDIKSKMPHSIQFNVDKFGTLDKNGIIQTSADGVVRMPTAKFLVFSYQKEFGNPYGKTDLEAAYAKWWIKENAYRWLAMLLERFGVPPIFALYDPSGMNDNQISALRTAIERIQAATAGAIPRASKDALELWAPELAGQTGRVFIPALQMLNRDIARALLMPGLLGLAPDTQVGSFARARVEFDVFVLMIEHLRNEVADAINKQVIVPLLDFNFNIEDGKYPEFKFLPMSNDLRLDLFKAWSDFVKAQVVTSSKEDEAHIRKALGFPKLEELSEEEPDDGDMSPEDPEDDGDDSEDENDGGGDPIPQDSADKQLRKRYRQKTKFEKEVNFEQIEEDLTTLEQDALAKIVPELISVRDRFLTFVETKFDGEIKFATELKELRGLPAVRMKIFSFLVDAYNHGSLRMSEELNKDQQAFIKVNEQGEDTILRLPSYQQQPNYKPKDALKWLRSKSFWITGVIDSRIREKSRGILLQAVGNGEHITKTMQKLKTTFEPYVGDSTKIRDGVVIQPSRLETIVRTNATDAFNQGRIVEARKAGEFLTGFQYSAVLDSVTTAVCQHLDGRVFRPDDPALDELRPPRHFNCRSVLVAVTIDEPVEEDDFITPAEVGKGLELSGEDFGGPARVTGLKKGV